MKVSLSWLSTHIDLSGRTTAQLSDLLTFAGIEVEGIDEIGVDSDKIVVGQILESVQHPNADRLRVCRVDVGGGEVLQIVCGAPNVVEGMKAPLARVGAKLPAADGAVMEIRRAAMRGVDSEGMLCSARELGLSDDQSGLLVLPADATVGRNLRDALDLNDQLFTVKLTPNRADCLSILGIAREVAALTGTPLTPPAIPAVPAMP